MGTTGEHNTQHERGHRRKEEAQTSLDDWLHSVPRHNSSPDSSRCLCRHTQRFLLIKIEQVSYPMARSFLELIIRTEDDLMGQKTIRCLSLVKKEENQEKNSPIIMLCFPTLDHYAKNLIMI